MYACTMDGPNNWRNAHCGNHRKAARGSGGVESEIPGSCVKRASHTENSRAVFASGVGQVDRGAAHIRGTKMKTYKIKIRTHEAWETSDGNLCASNVKAERIIYVDSFKDSLDYVHEKFDAEDVMITYLRIKDIS